MSETQDKATTEAPGTVLRRLRTQRGFSKYALSRATGISRANLFKMEAGERAVRPHHIAAIAEAMTLGPSEVEVLISAVVQAQLAALEPIRAAARLRCDPEVRDERA